MTMRRLPAVLAVLALLALTGCAGFSVVKGGQRQAVGAGLSVVPPNDWNRFTSPGQELWTLDGPALQHILFVKGAKDGEVIWPVPAGERAKAEKKDFPVFRKGMNAIEISELFQATMAHEKFKNLKMDAVRPQTVGEKSGFTFQFTCQSESGLQVEGIAAGTVIEDRLYMVIYRGAKLHYFDRGLADFRKMLETLQIDGAAAS